MSFPDLPDTWTDDHSIALILLAVTAVDGDIETAELAQVEHHLDGIRTAPDAAVHLSQDAYEYLLAASQDVDDSELIGLAADHAGRLLDAPVELKQGVLRAILTVTQADGAVMPEEIAVYKAVNAVWGV